MKLITDDDLEHQNVKFAISKEYIGISKRAIQLIRTANNLRLIPENEEECVLLLYFYKWYMEGYKPKYKSQPYIFQKLRFTVSLEQIKKSTRLVLGFEGKNIVEDMIYFFKTLNKRSIR